MINTTSILNDLIETLKDGHEGFRAAAGDVQSSDLKTLFLEWSLQRGRFVGELQALAQSLGESDPEDSGSVAGAVHRGWINLKAALTSKDDHAILAECERGEDVAVARYEKAINEEGLPANVRTTLSAQFVEVKAAHDRVRNLRDSLAVK